MPVEFWLTADGKKTLMVVRCKFSDMLTFTNDFKKFITESGFASVALLTGSWSPCKRERETIREMPEVFCFANEVLEKQDFYEKNSIRKFAWWIEKENKPY